MISNTLRKEIQDKFSENWSHGVGSSSLKVHIKSEIRILIEIAIPTIIIQIGTFLVFTMTASIVGKLLGSESLASLSLANTSSNLIIISPIIGTLSASETLQPQAYGMGHYREVGLLLVRGLVVCVLLLKHRISPDGWAGWCDVCYRVLLVVVG